jgi:DNA polymerase V
VLLVTQWNPTIKEKSLLVVDRSLVPRSHSLIVATLDGEFLVRRFFPNEKGLILLADNSKYRSLLIHPERDFEVWGVITSVIQKTV